MSQALYRKWRPARFDQIVGQEHVTQTLQNAVAADRIGHAYLFSGPRGTGKTTMARLLAKAANCLGEDLSNRPCNVCPPCIAVNEGRFLDLIEIDAASNTGVDDIRDLREKINFSPSEGRFKVYIIDEVHMLSPAAFNALLKTLEEPPSHAIFILATTEEHKVPLTIKSRCQLFNFRFLTNQETMSRLAWLAEKENLDIEKEALAIIAQHGSGSLRDAESLLDQLVAAPGEVITLERTQIILGTASSQSVVDLTDAFLAGNGQTGLETIHEALNSGADARQFSRQMVAYLRQLLLLKTAGGDLITHDAMVEHKQDMIRQAEKAGRRQLIAAVKGFNESISNSSRSWQPQLPLELAFIELLPQSNQELPSLEIAAPAPSKDIPDRPEKIQQKKEKKPSEKIKEVAREPEETLNKLPVAKATATEAEVSEPEPDPDAATIEKPIEVGISLEMVKKEWPKLREMVALRDRGLPALLASCKPLAVEGNRLILGFDYQILKEKFDTKKGAKEAVAETLSELLGTTCLLGTVVTDNYVPQEAQNSIDPDDFAALAEELGGVVREDK